MASAALLCQALRKDFLLLPKGAAWRLMLGREVVCGTRTAVDQVDLEVARGSFTAVLGHNGAGKSTLLRLLGGVFTPTAGTVQREGSLTAIYELGMGGRSMQTGTQFATRLLELMEAPPSHLPAMLADIADFAELTGRMDDPLYSYSSGMRSRLYFAVATVERLDIYLVDEVLAVGDPHFRAKCWRRLRERRRQGATGVFVSHDVESILKLCDRGHLMERGSLIYSGSAVEAVRRYVAEPLTGSATFVDLPPGTAFRAMGGAPLELRVRVRNPVDQPLLLNWSVDHVHPEEGWDLLLLEDYHRVTETAGCFDLCLRLPHLPLAPGVYHLNLFLAGHDPESGAMVAHDRRSWFHDGTHARLLVLPGMDSAGIPPGEGIALPWRMGAAG